MKKLKKDHISFGMNDSTTSFVSDVASETKFSFDIKLKKNRLIGFMKEKSKNLKIDLSP